MSWPPNTGQWNPGIAMTPDMNMGSYTADQWTAMQQQNWQQWAQWQQQYAQWQSQYGEKYAQQMQAMQAVSGIPAGGMPPLPVAVPPAAPPPPANPPPHENNQPLYANAQPAPVPPPAPKKPPAPYTDNAGNTQNWSYERDQPAQQQNPVNTEALKKLAEEERLFDIQFQKWEEEIEKWRRENVNHPDKQAYKEYEAKFEACRLQLLERRAQMNQKRARLLGGAAPATATTPANAGNIPTAVPPPLPNKTNYNMPSNAQTPSFNNKSANYSDKNVAHGYNDSKNTQNYQDKNNGQKYQDNRSSNFQQYNESSYDKKTGVDSKDRYDSYQGMEDYSQSGNYGADSSKSFLPQSSSAKGIPGLDLVPETEKAPKVDDVIDITQDVSKKSVRGMPDYSTISKGINNILGDEKLMNILSTIRGQPPPGPPSVGNNSQTMTTLNANVGQGAYSNPPPNNQWDRNNDNQWERNNDNQWERNNDNNQWDRNNYNNQWNRKNDQNQFENRQMPPNRQQDYRQNQNQQNHNYQNQTSYDDQRGGQDQWNYDNDNFGQEGNYEQGGNYKKEGNYGQDINQRGGPPFKDNVPPRGNGPPLRGNGPPPRGNGPRPLMEVNLNMHDARDMHDDYDAMSQRPPPPPRTNTWVEQPLFTPSVIVEYEHKPLRLKARDFIEPVHMFDYNHISKDGDNKKRDFEREADELFGRKPREDDYDRYSRDRDYHRPPPDRENDRYSRDQSRQFERRAPRDDREDYRSRVPPRDEYDRKFSDNRYDDRRRDDRDRNRRDDPYNRDRDSYRDRERERERDRLDRDRDNKDRYRDSRRSRSRDKDNRKRARSKESAISIISDDSIQSNPKKPKDVDDKNRKHVVMIDDLLEPPGRDMRPAKIVVILRGPPGSGKSYLAKLIRDREAEHGGTARIMSIDDYFMQEGEVEEKDPATGKIVKKPSLKYEYDRKSEETYENSLKRAFKRSCTDGYFSFLIYDAVNDHLRSYADIWNFARQNGFQVYVCTMESDANTCHKRNIHNRSLEDIQVICSRFFPTPAHHIQLDPTTLLQSAGITEVQMEDVEDDDDVIMEDVQHEVESVFTSKWEKMDDADKLARLDGTSKPLRPSQFSMEDYLQLDDWKPNVAKPGKKTVRWADIEESRQQEKMRAIGFVVGQTDWNRMTDPTMGSSALTQTKYIERVRRT